MAPFLVPPDAQNYYFTLIEVISTLPYWMGPNPFQSSRCWNRTNAQPFVSTFQRHHSTLSAILYHQLRSAVIEFWSPTETRSHCCWTVAWAWLANFKLEKYLSARVAAKERAIFEFFNSLTSSLSHLGWLEFLIGLYSQDLVLAFWCPQTKNR